MQKRTSRVIIETNLWISFLITNNFDQLDKIIFSDKCKIFFSEELLAEFIEVAYRPKFRKYFSSDVIIKITEYIYDYFSFIKIKSSVNRCRDKKDNFLLSLAVDGDIHYIITGDKDLREIKEDRKIKIITITQFLALMDEVEKL